MPGDPIKAMKKASRDLELEMGVRFTYNRAHKSKKIYDRKDKSWKKDSGSCYFFTPEKPYTMNINLIKNKNNYENRRKNDKKF